MTDPSQPGPDRRVEPESSPSEVEAGRDVVAGRDIAGRDIVTQTTYVGFSQEMVLRLVIVVGLLVFITAACFFSGGIAVGAGAFLALDRPVDSTLQAAESMQSKLNAIQALPPDQPFQLLLTETEISSYFRFFIGPQVGVKDGKVRLLSENELVVAGEVAGIGDRQAMATFEVQENPEEPLRLTGAAVQVLETGGRFGWIAVPASLLQPLEEKINQQLGTGFRITNVQIPPVSQPAWVIQGMTTE